MEQVALGVERGHRPGAGGGGRLAVDAVRDVDGGEWAHHLVYWVGPAIGGLVAAAVYEWVIREQPAQVPAAEPAGAEA